MSARVQAEGEDVLVKEHQYGPGARHTLDLYTPAGGAATGRVLVWVHGGAWVDRSKDEFGGLGRGLVRAGEGALSVAVVNYHLSPRSQPPTLIFPSHVLDVARALDWLWAHEQEGAQGRAVELYVCGHSAGAHTAGILALDPSYLARTQEGAAAGEAVRVAGWIGIAGIYDLPRLHSDFPTYKAHFLDYAFGEDESKWRDASPQYLDCIGHSTAPWLLWQSREDELVNVVQSTQFVKHLEGLSVSARYHEEAKGGKHWEGVHSLARPDSPLATLILAFVSSSSTSQKHTAPSDGCSENQA